MESAADLDELQPADLEEMPLGPTFKLGHRNLVRKYISTRLAGVKVRREDGSRGEEAAAQTLLTRCNVLRVGRNKLDTSDNVLEHLATASKRRKTPQTRPRRSKLTRAL